MEKKEIENRYNEIKDFIKNCIKERSTSPGAINWYNTEIVKKIEQDHCFKILADKIDLIAHSEKNLGYEELLSVFDSKLLDKEGDINWDTIDYTSLSYLEKDGLYIETTDASFTGLNLQYAVSIGQSFEDLIDEYGYVHIYDAVNDGKLQVFEDKISRDLFVKNYLGILTTEEILEIFAERPNEKNVINYINGLYAQGYDFDGKKFNDGYYGYLADFLRNSERLEEKDEFLSVFTNPFTRQSELLINHYSDDKDPEKFSAYDFRNFLEEAWKNNDSMDIMLYRTLIPVIIKAVGSGPSEMNISEYITRQKAKNRNISFTWKELDVLTSSLTDLIKEGRIKTNRNGIYFDGNEIDLRYACEVGLDQLEYIDGTSDNKNDILKTEHDFAILENLSGKAFYLNNSIDIDKDYGNPVDIFASFFNKACGANVLIETDVKMIFSILSETSEKIQIKNGQICNLADGSIYETPAEFIDFVIQKNNGLDASRWEQAEERLSEIYNIISDIDEIGIQNMKERFDFQFDDELSGPIADSGPYYLSSKDGTVSIQVYPHDAEDNKLGSIGTPTADITAVYERKRSNGSTTYAIEKLTDVEIECDESNIVHDYEMAAFLVNTGKLCGIPANQIVKGDSRYFNLVNKKAEIEHSKIHESNEPVKKISVTAEVQQDFLPTKRSKKTRTMYVNKTFDVEIQCPKEKEFPVAFKVTDHHDIVPGYDPDNEEPLSYDKLKEISKYENLTEEIRVYNGRFYKPIHKNIYGTCHSTLYVDSPSYIKDKIGRSVSSIHYHDNEDEYDAEKSVLLDNNSKYSDEINQKIKENASGYLYFNDSVWEECGEPYIERNTFGLRCEPGLFIGYRNKPSDKTVEFGYNAFHQKEAYEWYDKTENSAFPTQEHKKYAESDFAVSIEVLMPEMVQIKDSIDIENEKQEIQEQKEKGTLWCRTSWKGWEFSADKNFSNSIAIRPQSNGFIALAFSGDNDRFLRDLNFTENWGKYSSILWAIDALTDDPETRSKLGLSDKYNVYADLTALKLVNTENPEADVKKEICEKLGIINAVYNSNKDISIEKIDSGYDYDNSPYLTFVFKLNNVALADAPAEERQKDILFRLQSGMDRPSAEDDIAYLTFSVNSEGREGWSTSLMDSSGELISCSNYPAGEGPDSFLREQIDSLIETEYGNYKDILTERKNEMKNFLSVSEISKAFGITEKEFMNKANVVLVHTDESQLKFDDLLHVTQSLIDERIDSSMLDNLPFGNSYKSAAEHHLAEDIVTKKMLSKTSYNDIKESVKNLQEEFENKLKNSPSIQDAIGSYKLENPRFFFENDLALATYEKDRKLMSEITVSDKDFLHAYCEKIRSIPDMFGTITDINANNQLNVLTFAKFREGWKNILNENLIRSEQGRKPLELSVQTAAENIPDYCNVSELGKVLTSQGAYYNEEKDIFEKSFSQYFCNEMMRENKEIIHNRKFGIDEFLTIFSDFTQKNKEKSLDSVSVMKTLYKGFTKSQKSFLKEELSSKGITDKKLKAFLDLYNKALPSKEKKDPEKNKDITGQGR